MIESTDNRLSADARLIPFASRGGFLFAGLTAIGSLAFIVFVVAIAFILTSQPGTVAVNTDFRVFWTAGQLAVAGDPLGVHDLARLTATHPTNVNAYMPWLYPPAYLIFVTPLGVMSFPVAYLAWTVLSLALLAAAAWPFTAGIPQVWVAVVLAPAVYPTILLGQNTLFWMAGLLAALWALREERFVLAGIFIGCLTLKPQLGIMIPFALLALGLWRTIFSATVTAGLLLLLPTLYYGTEYWPLLRLSLTELWERVHYNVDSIRLMLSPAFFLTFVGVGKYIAWAMQWAISAASALGLVLLWRNRNVSFDLKATGLLCAIMLSAPYLWYYEGALLAGVALFLLRGGVLSLRPLHLLLLVPLWIGGGLQALNYLTKSADARWLGASFVSPVLLICFGLCLRKALARPAVTPLA